jgi:high-affinity Fe2+/Pb2+ permease
LKNSAPGKISAHFSLGEKLMKFVKHLKKGVVAAFLGFLTFAPPGTLIFIAVFVLGLIGRTWFVAGVAGFLILLAVCAFVFRHRLSEIPVLKSILQKLKK